MPRNTLIKPFQRQIAAILSIIHWVPRAINILYLNFDRCIVKQNKKKYSTKEIFWMQQQILTASIS